MSLTQQLSFICNSSGSGSSQPSFRAHVSCNNILVDTMTGENQPETSKILATMDATYLLLGIWLTFSFGVVMGNVSLWVSQCTPIILEQNPILELPISLSSSGIVAYTSLELDCHFLKVIWPYWTMKFSSSLISTASEHV